MEKTLTSGNKIEILGIKPEEAKDKIENLYKEISPVEAAA